MAVGGARPCVSCSLSSSSSSICSPNARHGSSSLSCAPSQNRITGYSLQKFNSMAAFQSPSNLFSYPSPYRLAQKKQRKPCIFLPHLVASLVCPICFIVYFRQICGVILRASWDLTEF